MAWTSPIANGLWGASALPMWLRYRRWLRDPARQQAARLARYLRENRDTAFGRAHGFDRIDSVRAYQARVPLRSYDEFTPFIDRIAAGEPNVLTRAPVRRLGFTSGSTAATKLVPYTSALVQELTRGVAVWMADLFLADPRLAGGPAYWSITPIGQAQRAAHAAAAGARIPVGFDDDTEYLGTISRRIAAATMAVPREVGEIEDVAAIRYVTLLCLLRAPDLRLVSVWHPSFFTLMLDALEEHWPSLLRDLAGGTIAPVHRLSESLSRRLRERMPPASRRAEALARLAPSDVRSIWPALRLISCWTDGPARLALSDLERRVSGIRVQGKGLIATEAFVTVPFAGERPLALPCHFFEFESDDGGVWMGHELREDAEYRVIVTTGGGLYRYRLQDRVRVTGFVERTPSLEFLGKEQAIVDVVGEKLSEGFVIGVLQRVFASHAIAPRFALLAPEEIGVGAERGHSGARAAAGARVAYTLFLAADLDVDRGAARLASVRSALEAALRANPHYAYAIDLGQLAPSRVVHVGRGAQAAYLARRTADGMRLGDIKPAALSAQLGWTSVFADAEAAASGDDRDRGRCA